MVGAAGPECRIQAATPNDRKRLIRQTLQRIHALEARTAAQQVCVAARSFVSRRVLPSYRVRFWCTSSSAPARLRLRRSGSALLDASIDNAL